MNDDERGTELPVSEADTQPPDVSNSAVPSPDRGWQMPEPKFQQSSGYLPQGYLDKLGLDAPQPTGAAVAAAPAAQIPDVPEVPGVEPQPDLSEQLTEPVAVVTSRPAAQERSRAAKISMVILGLIAMAAFISVFLAVVYYLFLAPADGASPF